MEEDKANGVFPVKADEYISKLRAAMGLEWANRPDAETPPCGNRK
jgi:hypothetical protein